MAGRSLNKVLLIGNLGKDPESRYTTSGTPVCSFSMATSYSVKDGNGNYNEQVEWHNITCWSRLAEIAQQYLHKGSKVFIEGHLKTESWDDKASGQKKYMTKIVADQLIMLDGKSADSGDQNGFDQSRQSRGGGRPVTADDPITNEDIPFAFIELDAPDCPRKWRKRSLA
jgi:single-strand DNA-binding protein